MIKFTGHLTNVPREKLIQRFKIKTKNKIREVNNPIPELKELLKEWNYVITSKYEDLLIDHGVSEIPHAYLPNKSIRTNARIHRNSPVIQFDFKGFYDSCKFNYFKDVLYDLDPDLNPNNEKEVERLLIDPNTGGVTQGLPVSGALAGISLIPFWVKLKENLPENIIFTQYSDDLTFSYTGKEPKEFSIPILSQKIYETLKEVKLDFKLNDKKTRFEKHQRKVTGISINVNNQLTPSRDDYRFLRHALYILSKSDNLDNELKIWGFKSKQAFIGKISYMRSIDDTGKINNLIYKYRSTCYKHNIFVTWIKDHYTHSAFV